MILKPLLPDLHVGAEFLLRSIRKPALNELHRLFEVRLGRYQNMNVIGHNDKFVKQIRLATIVIESIDEQFRPSLRLEQRATPPCLSRDHVGLTGVSRVFSLRPQLLTSGAKAPVNCGPDRRA